MKQLKATKELELAIELLETKRKQEKVELTKQLFTTFESLKPFNLLKQTVKEMVSSSEIKKDLSSIAIGMITGYIAKKVAIGNTRNPFKKLAGIAVEMLVATEATENAGSIKSFVSSLFNKLKTS